MCGAGILLATRDPLGRDFVVLGRKRPSRKAWQAGLAQVGLSLHGWSVPFGTLEAADHGNFSRCAVRETAQELLNVPESHSYATCVAELGRAIGIAAEEVEGRLELLHTDGLMGDRRTFLLRVPFREGLLESRYRGNWEFVDGLQWYRCLSPDDVRDGDQGLTGTWHRATRPTLQSFQAAVGGGNTYSFTREESCR